MWISKFIRHALHNEYVLFDIEPCDSTLNLYSLHLPSHTITALADSCPSLSTLKLKYANLAPKHLLDIAHYMPSLEFLSLGKCEVWFTKSQTATFPTLALSPTSPDIMEVDNAGNNINQEVDNMGEDDDDTNIVDGDDDDFHDSPSRVSYTDIIHFLASHLPKLTSLHFNQCILNALPTSHPAAQALSNTNLEANHRTAPAFHPLKSLKIFDVGSNRPTDSEVQDLTSTFQFLESLRLDVHGSALIPSGKGIQWHAKPSPFPKIKILELRGSKDGIMMVPTATLSSSPTLSLSLGVVGNTIKPSSLKSKSPTSPSSSKETKAKSPTSPPTATFPQLESISLWSPPLPTLHLLLQNPTHASTLTKLCLNYLPEHFPSNSAAIPLPNLKHLEIRALTHLAPETCLNLLNVTTFSSRQLRYLIIEAFHRESSLFPLNHLQSLTSRCPLLTHFTLSNFNLPPKTLMHLQNHWRDTLECLSFKGPSAITKVDKMWESDELGPFLDSHRRLKLLNLGVGEIETGEIKVKGGRQLSNEELVITGRGMRSSESTTVSLSSASTRHDDDDDSTTEMEIENTDPAGHAPLTWQERTNLLRKHQVADMGMYRKYAEYIKKRWWWLEEVTVLGPLTGAPFLR
jgi:hypothetical protein